MAKSKKLGVRKNENVDVLCYRFATSPTKEQIIQLNKTIGCCRYLWNRMLGDHNTLYQEIGIVPNNTPADYKNLEECFWLKEVDSLALANVQLNLNQAFQKFFNGEAKTSPVQEKESLQGFLYHEQRIREHPDGRKWDPASETGNLNPDPAPEG